MEENKQNLKCKNYNVDLFPSLKNQKLGVSLNVKSGILPNNGLRHPPEGDTTGWYIWAGEEFSEDDDFFVPIHVEHLSEWCPVVIEFLGLPAGHRFLIDKDGHEDVWFDENLLKI